MSKDTYDKLSAVGQRRAKIMYWVDIFTGAALMTVAVVVMYLAIRAFLFAQI